MAKKPCPQCAESVNEQALVCRFCNYTFSDEEKQESKRTQRNRTLLNAGVAVSLLVFVIQCANYSPSPSQETSAAAIAAIDAAQSDNLKLQIDRFSWEAEGDDYCRANAKLTNVGTSDLRFARLTLQFLKKGELVSSDSAYLEVTELPPGSSSTWNTMYRCPGGNVEVEITSTTRGKNIVLTDPPKG